MNLMDENDAVEVEAIGEGKDQSAMANANEAEARHTDQVEELRVDSEDNQVSETVWRFDDDTEGTGDKPEWLIDSKFKSVSEQAKAYKEAEKRLGAFKGAPKEYDLTLDSMPDVKLQADDPILDEFLTDARENNVSQEYVSKMLATYVKGIKMNNPDPKKELESLGPNGRADLKTLGNWARNSLSTSEVDIFKKMVTTADSVRVFQKLRGEMTKADTQPIATNAPQVSKESVLKKIHDPRYETDETFRNQVREELSSFG